MSFDSRAVPHKKRPAEESLSAPPAKRSSSVDQQDFRASIKHTYSLFRVLSSNESPTTELKLQAFQQLLQALAGSCEACFANHFRGPLYCVLKAGLLQAILPPENLL